MDPRDKHNQNKRLAKALAGRMRAEESLIFAARAGNKHMDDKRDSLDSVVRDFWEADNEVARLGNERKSWSGEQGATALITVDGKEFWIKPGAYTGTKVRYDLGISSRYNLYWKPINRDGTQTVPDLLVQGDDEILMENNMQLFTRLRESD